MKTTLSPLVLVAALTAPMAVFAADFTSLDADGSGGITLNELQAMAPEATGESFAAADADSDGQLTEEELSAAMQAGTLSLPGME